jgi:hypothetical protein
MDGEQDGGQQDGEGEREESAFPGLVGLSEGGEAHAEDQDEDDQRAEVEPEAPHGLVSRLPEVQEIIWLEIQRGAIRVRLGPDGSLRIVPVRQREDEWRVPPGRRYGSVMDRSP